ncbi:MAG: hypothetical protein LC776_07995 [Acidobacteria bacterium]|nr:hypothetical protein [Acidobacteriota bacterium]
MRTSSNGSATRDDISGRSGRRAQSEDAFAGVTNRAFGEVGVLLTRADEGWTAKDSRNGQGANKSAACFKTAPVELGAALGAALQYQILVLLADVAITAAQLSRPTAADNKTERGWPDGMRQSM